MNIDARGAPPEATKAEKAETMSISGMQTPMPVSARLPTSGDVPDVYAVNDVVQHVDKLRDNSWHGELGQQLFYRLCAEKCFAILHVDTLLE